MNVGVGPALDVSVVVRHPTRAFIITKVLEGNKYYDFEREVIPPGSSIHVMTAVPINSDPLTDDGSQADVLFSAEYSDVYGRRWRSARNYRFVNETTPELGNIPSASLEPRELVVTRVIP